MAGYRHSNPDRAKAAVAALLVHAAIGAAFLTGLVTNVSRRPSEVIQTFDVTEPPPPPPPVVEIEESAPKGDPGEAGKKAEPTPIVAPEPRIEVPAKPPVVAAPVPAQGTAPSAGAAQAGTGTGAGGSGSGLGGGGAGGSGSGAGFTPARRISKIPDREYRRFVAASGLRRGSVAITVKVNTDGRASDCRVVRSSGNSGADSLMCQLTIRYVRFRPARDPQGRLVAQDITWVPDWAPN
ncbi:MAG TPA: energy transducer TonB [Sphingomicrobium sp.]|jgi:protein TonB|nr:energy transducer TonB [Sphingomicrobium sp.]